MAAALSVRKAVNNKASSLGLVKDFWAVDRNFRALLKDLNGASALPVESILPFAGRLMELYAAVNGVLDISGKNGLINRTFFNGSIHSIRHSNEMLKDYIERLNVSLDSDIRSEAAEALAEYARRETVSMDSLR